MKKSTNSNLYGWVVLLFICVKSTAQDASWRDQYEKVRPSENVFIVSKSGKMAVVGQTGLPITELIYDTIYNFRDGIAVVGKGRREVNQFGKVLSDFKYGYLDKTGRLIVDTRYEYINPFSEGLGLIEITGSKDSYDDRTGYVFVDKAGQVIINHKPVYNCLPFQGSTAYVEVPKVGFWLPPYDDGRDNGRHTQLYDVNGQTIYGNYLDRQGKLLIPWQYDTIAPYVPGYLRPVRKNDKWGFLDSLATLKVALQYDDIDQDSAFFWQNRRRVGVANQFGFIDSRTGNLVVPLRYEASKPSSSNLVWVRSGQLWGVLNSDNKLIIPFVFTDAQPFEQQIALVKRGGHWGIINRAGVLLAPVKYDTIYNFQERKAAFRQVDQFGFLDLSGREIIPARYSHVSSFKKGHAFATLYGLFITLNSDGSWASVKLQASTLKILLWVVLILAVVSLVWWRRKQTIIRNSAI